MKIHKQTWSKTTRFIIMEDNAKASAILEIYNEPTPEESIKCFVFALQVDEDIRGYRIGSRLLETAEQLAKKEGEKYLFLEWNKADSPYWILDWYARHGYEEKAFGKDNALLRKEL